MLNVTRPNKLEAYQMLQRAGELGHSQARVLVAWAQLLGSPMPQDIEAAKQAFQELVELGVPDAHMVSSALIISSRICKPKAFGLAPYDIVRITDFRHEFLAL
jgi:TPR repeat protein